MSCFYLGITAEDIYDGKLLERTGLLFYKLRSEDAVCPQRAWLLFGRDLSLVLGTQTSVLWHRNSVCSPFSSWELGQMSQPCPSAQQPSLLLCWLDFSDEPQTTLTLDHVWSMLHWWRNLLLSLHGPVQVLWDCVLLTESTALTLGSPSGNSPAIASPYHPHGPRPSLGDWRLTPRHSVYANQHF